MIPLSWYSPPERTLKRYTLFSARWAAVALLWPTTSFHLHAQSEDSNPNRQKEIDRREADYLKRSLERAQRPIETERDKLLEELVKIPGPALDKDNFDPWFDSLNAGANLWRVDGNSQKTFREMHKRIAKQAGATDTITREQFRAYAKLNLTEANSPAWRPPETTPESDAERLFREGDRDRTRRMEDYEMSETLLGSLNKWDRDRDGKIDLEEYTAYYLARMVDTPPAKGEATATSKTTTTSSAFDDERPYVLRYGKLPKGLPSWFLELDTDHDGQVGLYEWRTAGRSIEEFQKLDLNEDGFIVVEECLAAVKAATPTVTSNTVTKK